MTDQTAEIAPFHRIRPSETDWEIFPDPAGRPTTPVRFLSEDPYMVQADFPANFEVGAHWHRYNTIYLITQGEITFGDEGTFKAGDVRRVTGGHVYGPEKAGPKGVQFHLISLGGPIELNWADLREVPDDLKKTVSASAAPAKAVRAADAEWAVLPRFFSKNGVDAQILSDDLTIIRGRLKPGERSLSFTYPTDTFTFLEQGMVNMGGEGNYNAGDVRFGKQGHIPGNVIAGPEGAQFTIVGLSAPIHK